MLPRERVALTLEHREPDLIPWGEHYIDWNIYEMVLGRPTWVHAKIKEDIALWEGKRDEVVESYKRDTLDITDALGMDIITVYLNPAAGTGGSPYEKVDEETYRDRAGNLYRVSASTGRLMPFKRVAPAAEYTVPTPEQIREQIEQFEANPPAKPDDSCWELTRHVVKERKDTHWINICIGDFGWPMVGPTEEEQYMNLILHPELHEPITELNAKRLIHQLKWYAEEGVDSVMPAGDLGSSTALLASPKILRDTVLPWWKEYVRAGHDLGLKMIKHCCGNVWEALPMLIEAGYDGYEGIQASGTMDMKPLKEKHGDAWTLWGGIWNEHLILGTPEDIENDAKHAIKYGAPGGGFIYGATHSLAVGTKPENLERMKECREKYGHYPINVPD